MRRPGVEFCRHGADATLAGVSSVDPGIAAPVTAPTIRRSRRSSHARAAASRSAPTAWCLRPSGSSAANAPASRARHASRCAPTRPCARSRWRSASERRWVSFCVRGGTAIGLFTFILAYGVGYLTGRATLRGAGYYRSPTTAWIAAGGAAWAYVIAGVVDRRRDRRQRRAPTCRCSASPSRRSSPTARRRERSRRSSCAGAGWCARSSSAGSSAPPLRSSRPGCGRGARRGRPAPSPASRRSRARPAGSTTPPRPRPTAVSRRRR